MIDLAAAQDYAVVIGIGIAVGGTDLIGRYRDAPFKAIKSRPALLYLVVNAAAAFAALYIARIFDWKFGVEGDAAVRWTQVLVAGFAAMALFRTSLFVTAIGDGDDDEANIGPSSVLKAILDAADRGVDRERAAERASEVTAIMQDVDFGKAVKALPAQIVALLQNVSEEDQTAFANQITKLEAADLEQDDATKTALLGLAIMGLAGPEVLKAAVSSLGDRIKIERVLVARA